MWAFYADNHTGCCIELEIKTKLKDWHFIPINYTDRIIDINNKNATIENIFSNKSTPWKYEQEVRYIRTVPPKSNNRKRYLNISITRIFLGIRMSENDKNFIHKLLKCINPNINVINLKKREIDFGYNK